MGFVEKALKERQEQAMQQAKAHNTLCTKNKVPESSAMLIQQSNKTEGAEPI